MHSYICAVVWLLSHVWLLQHQGLQHHRLSCPSLSPGVYSNSSPLSRCCHPTILSSVVPFSCLQSFPASGSFLMNQFFTSGGQSIKGSASAISPFNEHSGLAYFRIDWLDLLAVKGLSGVFSNNTVQKHQFFSTQLSLWSNTHIHTWQLKKPYFDYMDLCWQSNVSAF